MVVEAEGEDGEGADLMKIHIQDRRLRGHMHQSSTEIGYLWRSPTERWKPIGALGMMKMRTSADFFVGRFVAHSQMQMT